MANHATRIARLEAFVGAGTRKPIRYYVNFIDPQTHDTVGAFAAGQQFDRKEDEDRETFRSRVFLAVRWDPNEPDFVPDVRA